MTSLPPPDGLPSDDIDPGDDAVLAVLDDTATAEQRRLVARDPELRARLAEQRTVAEVLAVPPPPLAEDVASRMRSLAIDGRDAPDTTPVADDATGADDDGEQVVVPLAPRRTRRRGPGLPAVAAVVILLVGIGLALIVSDRPGEETATQDSLSAEEAQAEDAARDLGAQATESAGPVANDADGTTGEAGDAGGGAGSGSLARYADQAALERDLRAVDPVTLQPPGAGNAADPAADRAAEQGELCDHGLQAVDADLEPLQAARLVLVDDVEVLVVSNPTRASADGPAGHRLTALDARSCTPLFAVQR